MDRNYLSRRAEPVSFRPCGAIPHLGGIPGSVVRLGIVQRSRHGRLRFGLPIGHALTNGKYSTRLP